MGIERMRITALLALAASLWLGATMPAFAQEAAPVTPPTMTLQHERLPGMCVSLSGPQGQSESRPCNASPEQEFQLPVAGVGPILSGDKCVAPRGQGAYPQLYAQTCDGTPEQQWAVKADGEIRNGTGHCLALLGASSRTGERVYAGECPTGLPANHWRAVPVDATLNPVSGVLESVRVQASASAPTARSVLSIARAASVASSPSISAAPDSCA